MTSPARSNLNNALLAVRMHEVCRHKPGAGHEASLWLSTYGVPQEEVEGVRSRWQEVLDRLFAAQIPWQATIA